MKPSGGLASSKPRLRINSAYNPPSTPKLTSSRKIPYIRGLRRGPAFDASITIVAVPAQSEVPSSVRSAMFIANRVVEARQAPWGRHVWRDERAQALSISTSLILLAAWSRPGLTPAPLFDLSVAHECAAPREPAQPSCARCQTHPRAQRHPGGIFSAPQARSRVSHHSYASRHAFQNTTSSIRQKTRRDWTRHKTFATNPYPASGGIGLLNTGRPRGEERGVASNRRTHAWKMARASSAHFPSAQSYVSTQRPPNT